MARPEKALAQLQELRYADKYRAAGEPIHLIEASMVDDA